MFTISIVTLYLAQQSSLYLGRIAVTYTPLFTNLIVTLYLAQQSGLYLGWITVLYTLVFTILIVTIVFSTAIQLVFRPDCSALYT